MASEASIEVLRKIFGDRFAESYREMMTKAQEIPQEKLEKIKQFALEAMRTAGSLHVKYDNLDVILVQAPADPTKFPVVRTSAGNYKVGMLWAGSKSMRGPFISVFTADRAEAERLAGTPHKFWLLVGKLQERQWGGDITYSFRAQGIIPLD